LTEKRKKMIENEIVILQLLKHKNVIHLHSYSQTSNRYYLIFDTCNGGDLEMLQKARGKLTEKEGKIILKQIVLGLTYMFDVSVVHRDIKLANVLLHFPDEP
jgi:serine/threonine protein kinase